MECNKYNERLNNNYSNNIAGMFPNRVMYGHAYVPNQVVNKLFTPEDGLKCGTMYPELESPYEPCDSMEEIRFLRGGMR